MSTQAVVGPFRSNPRSFAGNTEGQSPLPPGAAKLKEHIPVVTGDHFIKKAPSPSMKPAQREAVK